MEPKMIRNGQEMRELYLKEYDSEQSPPLMTRCGKDGKIEIISRGSDITTWQSEELLNFLVDICENKSQFFKSNTWIKESVIMEIQKRLM